MNKSLYTILGVLALSGIKSTKKGSSYRTVVKKTSVYHNGVDFGIIWKNDDVGNHPQKVDYFIDPNNLSSLESQLFEYLEVIIQDLVKVKIEVITYLDHEDNINKRSVTVEMWSLNNVPVKEHPQLENSISAFIKRYDCTIDKSNIDYYGAGAGYDEPEPFSQQQLEEDYDSFWRNEDRIEDLFDDYGYDQSEEQYYSEEQSSYEEQNSSQDIGDIRGNIWHWKDEIKTEIPIFYKNGQIVFSHKITKPKTSKIRRR